MKQSLRSTVLSPPSRSDVLFASETKRSCKSLRVKRCVNSRAVCGMRFMKSLTRQTFRLYLCRLQKGTSYMLGGPKAVIRGLCFDPK